MNGNDWVSCSDSPAGGCTENRDANELRETDLSALVVSITLSRCLAGSDNEIKKLITVIAVATVTNTTIAIAIVILQRL